MDTYIEDILRRGELYLEIERIRQILVGMHKYPIPSRERQRELVSQTTKIFQALLRARDARRNTILIE